MTKSKKLYLLSLGGVALFSILTFVFMLPKSFLKIGDLFEDNPSGINMLSGDYNDINGVSIASSAFIIISIILSILILAAVILRLINVVPKFSKAISSLVISVLGIALAACAIIFIVKIGAVSEGSPLISYFRKVKHGICSILYLISAIFTALFAVSLFVTDKKGAVSKKGSTRKRR